MERVKVRLESWEDSLLWKGGRLTLIKSSLSNMRSYVLSFYTISASVAFKLERSSETAFEAIKKKLGNSIWW